MEEKYKKAMVSNAQLDNDKANLIYQVDTLKDVIEEMEEQMAEMKRELEEKSKVNEKRIFCGKRWHSMCLLPSMRLVKRLKLVLCRVQMPWMTVLDWL